MKTKYLFLLAAAALSLANCTLSEESTLELRPLPEIVTPVTPQPWEEHGD